MLGRRNRCAALATAAVLTGGLTAPAAATSAPAASAGPASAAHTATMTDLGTLGGTYSNGRGINARFPTQTYHPSVERGRVHVQNNTVVTDKGTLLRGSTIWYLNPSLGAPQASFASDAATSDVLWNALKTNHLNAIRVAVAYNAQSDSPTMAQITSYLDKLLAKLDAFGMYMIIDYHESGSAGSQRYDINRLRNFWSTIAPRYAKHTNVLYELYNEPVRWIPADYTAQNIADQKKIYTLIRAKAPDTHIIILSFAVPQNWGNDSPSMVSIARQFDGVVDWTKTSVGFHAYHQTSSASWVNLKKFYPTICTEFMGPSDNTDPASFTVMVDGTRWTDQLFERYGISWLAWNTTTLPADINGNLIDQHNDAVSKGYMWPSDAHHRRRQP